MELEGKSIHFIGDSITEGYGTSDFDGARTRRFTSLLESEYGLAHANNYGVCGSRIARQRLVTNERCDRDFCERLDDLAPEADGAVVFGGTNDFGHGTAFIGTPADRTPSTFYGACHYLMRGLVERYPGKPVVIATPLHRLLEDSPFGDGQKTWEGRPLRDYVAILRETAEFYALPVLDLYASSGLQPKVPVIQKLYVPDGLHPNDAGHRILADRFARFLRSL